MARHHSAAALGLLLALAGLLLCSCGGTLLLDPDALEDDGGTDPTPCVSGTCPDGQYCNDGVCADIPEEMPCGPLYPAGDCEAGETCIESVCHSLSDVPSPCTPLTNGNCDPGEACVVGACVAIGPGEACAASNPEGLCPGGQLCVGGICYVDDGLECSVSNPDGYCPEGQSCSGGSCLSDFDTCSPSLPTGSCTSWRECVQGECVGPIPPDACSPAEQDGICPAGAVCVAGTCTNVVIGVNACSPAEPQGLCPTGAACVDGACRAITSDSACSTGQPEGLCAGGAICEEGICSWSDCDDGGWACPPSEWCDGDTCHGLPCSPSQPQGLCADPTAVCVRGTCTRRDCDGFAINDCGGCAILPALPDTPCGACGDGHWACAGSDSVSCVDAVIEPRDFWFDNDGDGWGNPLFDPQNVCVQPEGWVDNAEDCDDLLGTINPGADELCNGEDDDCDLDVDEATASCADPCCDPAEVCDGGTCQPVCFGSRCGALNELCCTGDDLCINEQCVTPGGDCAVTDDCAFDEICEPSVGKCLPRAAVPACEYRPPVGVFTPAVECGWSPTAPGDTRDDVVATPVVVNLTDDNGDGLTDLNDTPDIAFLTYDYEGTNCCNVAATLRIITCHPDGTVQTLASLTSSPEMNNDTAIAAGDLDNDGVPEIVATYRITAAADVGTLAWRRVTPDGTSWEIMWSNPTEPRRVHTRGSPAIAIADLGGDGQAEVVIGNVILAGEDGHLISDGYLRTSGAGGIGNNAFLGPTAAVADIDLDGRLEIVAGNSAYDDDGALLWTYTYTSSNSTCGGSLPCDGFPAIANLDADPEAEIVIIRLGQVFFLEHDGTEMHPAIDLPIDDCTYNESGPPTVADFDGDGNAEIGTASADYYVVADLDCVAPVSQSGCDPVDDGVLWKVANQDCSSRVTASSVFDFEGDGAAEVVYADEQNFRIFDGTTGAILFSDATHSSHTRLESAVIADVDNDGNAEIIIPANSWSTSVPAGSFVGLRVWGDVADNWVRTRRIWNQHAYHVTNVDEMGHIPSTPAYGWQDPRFNNFRQNVQPGGLFDAPNLQVAAVDAPNPPTCIHDLEVHVTVRNDGALSLPPGVVVEVTGTLGAEVVTERGVTVDRLFPGGEEVVTIILTFLGEGQVELDVTVDPDAAVNECIEIDNDGIGSSELDCGG